jgi:hypothetical protein
MKVLYLTNEYPPHVYGGAGVHIEYLSKEVAELTDVEVRCFGNQVAGEGKVKVAGFAPMGTYNNVPNGLQSVFNTIDRDLQTVGAGIDADIVHCHTW